MKIQMRLNSLLAATCVLFCFTMTGDTYANSTEQISATPSVLMWSTPRCPYCQKARVYFKAKKIVWREVDVSGRGIAVPIIFVCDQRMEGWNQRHFERLLARCR